MTIDNEAENEFLRKYINLDTYIGLTDKDTEGVWRWSADDRLTWCGSDHGRTTGGTTFTNWEKGQPASTHCSLSSHNEKDYWYCPDKRKFEDALMTCKSEDATLVRIDDETENTFISSIAKDRAWLGGSRGTSGEWTWLKDGATFWLGGDGGRSIPGHYTNWRGKQPHGCLTTKCLMMDGGATGTWFAKKCSKKHAFVCEDTVKDNARNKPDINDCAVLQHSGKWRGVRCDRPRPYICEMPEPDAKKSLGEVAEYIRDDYRFGKPRVNHVTFSSDSSIKKPFEVFDKRFGLRECVDTLSPVSKPRLIPYTGLEVTDYAQMYQGLRVYARGYTVFQEPGTQVVREISGRIEHDINVDTTPVVSETSALLTAMTHIDGKLSDYPFQHLSGELSIYPTRLGPDATWGLAWVFSLPKIPERSSYFIVVSALTGAILYSADDKAYACPHVNIEQNPPKRRTEISVDALQQIKWGDPNKALISEVDMSTPYAVLYSMGVEHTGPLSNGPKIRAQCSGDSWPYVIGIPDRSISLAAGSSESDYAAGHFLAMQQCVKYFAKSFEFKPGLPWIGLDGQGVQDIVIQMYGYLPQGPSYSFDNLNFAFKNPPPGGRNIFLGASIEMVCHEFTHGLAHSMGVQSNLFDLESKAVHEGIADIFGSVAEMSVRGYPGQGGWCFAGDNQDNVACLRNLEKPASSNEITCTIKDTQDQVIHKVCPTDYRGPDYCTFPNRCDASNVSCCTEHRNSTIMSHWFYMLAKGENAQNSSSCPYSVQPLDPDLKKSTQKATQILFSTLRNQANVLNKGYESIADATIKSARVLYGENSKEVASVVKAWFAANVKEDSYEGTAASVKPARETTKINPWIEFQWPVRSGETAWDFELVPEDVSQGQSYEAFNITDIKVIDGKKIGFLKLALPFNTTTRYFWRVRPHEDKKTWLDCYPIHSFVGTGKPETLSKIEINETDEKGLVRPGSIELSWRDTPVLGAEAYQVYVSTTDSACNSGADIYEKTVRNFTVFFSGIQPLEHYHIGIRPVGPASIVDGKASEGTCFTKEFDTTASRPPTLTYPPDGFFFSYDGGIPPKKLNWNALDGPEKFRVSFREIDENGNCDAVSVHNEIVDSGCSELSYCQAWLDKIGTSLRNPTGYCWQVTSIAANGKESAPSETRKLRFRHKHTWQIQPGDQIGHAEPNKVSKPNRYPAPLPGDSYGKSVKFQWRPDPDAAAYILKIGRWPWDTPIDPPDPENCAPKYLCDDGPLEVTFQDIVTGTEKVFSEAESDKVSKGRYCWTVWPITADPNNPGKIGKRQALVGPYPQFCYTSGPALPRIELERRPQPDRHHVGPVNGKIFLDYIPDGQWFLQYTDIDMTYQLGPGCGPPAIDRYWYNDFFDCVIDFKIPQKEGTSSTLIVSTYNSEAWPAPILDESSLVHTVTDSFTQPKCGGPGEPCCLNISCNNHPDRNRSQKCDYSSSKYGICLECGRTGDPCCIFSSCGNVYDHSVCKSDIDLCVSCGGVGQPCCEANKHGVVCDAPEASCQSGTCKLPDKPPAKPCNAKIEHGGNTPEHHTIELGKSKGTTQLTVNTYEVPDNIIVSYEGIKYPTGCSGTTGKILRNLVWTCDGVSCSRLIKYSGKSSTMEVQVIPDCKRWIKDTKWWFKLTCP